MDELLEDVNPAFIKWAERMGISLEAEEDYGPWLHCWGNGYAAGVDDVKKIIRGDYSTPKEVEQEPTHWDCCGIRHPIHRRCQCGETAN